MRPCRATRAGTQAPPLPNSIIFFHAIPHKQNNHSRAIHPNEAVGAAPMCPPEHPRSGVSIREVGFVHHALCAGNLTMDAPLWGDTGGHIGTAPTYLHHIFPRNPTQTKSTVHVQSTQTNRVNNLHNTSGAEMHRALPPPFFKTSCVCKLASR